MSDRSVLATGLILQNRYEVVKQLGRGGFGRTYLARDRHRQGEYCVLKEFAPQFTGHEELKKAKELFNREAGVLYQLKHPQVPRFREMLSVPIEGTESMFLVQDYVEGATYLDILAKYQENGRVFSEAEVYDLLIKILPVLDYIHGQGAIHRDISPDNLIQTRDKLPVLIDFGGVKQAAADAASLLGPKRALTRIGKPSYAPEEQLRKGQADASSDLYSLGVTALVLLSGKDPQELYDSRNANWMWRSQVNVSPSFATILERMVAHFPRDRYQSAAELLQVLQQNRSQSRFPTLNLFNKPDASTALGNTLIIQPPSKQPTSRLVWLGAMALLIGGVWGLWKAIPLFPKTFPFFGQSQAQIPKEEALRADLAKRRQALNISEVEFNQQVDAEFYARYPQLKQRPLTNKAEDRKLRQEWYAFGDRVLDRLEKQKNK